MDVERGGVAVLVQEHDGGRTRRLHDFCACWAPCPYVVSRLHCGMRSAVRRMRRHSGLKTRRVIHIERKTT